MSPFKTKANGIAFPLTSLAKIYHDLATKDLSIDANDEQKIVKLTAKIWNIWKRRAWKLQLKPIERRRYIYSFILVFDKHP